MCFTVSHFIARLGIATILVSLTGCSNQPSWCITKYDFMGTHITSLVAPEKTTIAINLWFDQEPSEYGLTFIGPDNLPLGSRALDVSGFSGSGRLSDGRLLTFRCLTQDGSQGTMTFTLSGEPFPAEAPYSLTKGSLFLISTKGADVKIQQVNREIRHPILRARLEEHIGSDPQISAFIADAGVVDKPTIPAP